MTIKTAASIDKRQGFSIEILPRRDNFILPEKSYIFFVRRLSVSQLQGLVSFVLRALL
jgi:hypothetical protein